MKQKDIAILLTPILILTILWVIFSVYHNFTTSTITDPLTIQIIPLAGEFDNDYVNILKKRQRIEPLYEAQISSETEVSPTPTPIEAIINENEVASESSQTQGETEIVP